jgi:solute carrier family 25 (adenine nucleotide translocator) protein 4/5/6/31
VTQHTVVNCCGGLIKRKKQDKQQMGEKKSTSSPSSSSSPKNSQDTEGLIQESGRGKKFLVDFAAGGISAAVAKTATAPIERVKLILQTQDSNPRIKSGEVTRYAGIVDCFRRVRQEQGMNAFWRGNLTNVIRYFPTQAFNFAFKDTIKSWFPKYSSKKEFTKFVLTNTFSGGLAGAGSLCIVYPLDYARTRLASDVGSGKRAFNGLWDCLSKTARGPAGFWGLYNGFGVSVVGIIPYRGVYFGMFDSLAGVNPYQDRHGIVGLASKFAIAQFTAITAGYASYPFDTVRRRLQMQSELPRSEWAYKGTADCFSKILKEEGTSAFYKGAGSNVLRTIGAALVLVLYGEIKTLMGFEGSHGGSE